MAPAWRWVSLKMAISAHAEQIDEHGGGTGLRDLGLLEGAMARPQQLAAYGHPDAAPLRRPMHSGSRATIPS